MDKSRVLVVGGTGRLGKHIVRGSAKEGLPTFMLMRKSASAPDAARKALLDEFHSLGVVTLYGDLDDHASLVAALKQVDVVISAVGPAALLDGQLKLIAAIKEAGNIKRFVPSEYGEGCDKYAKGEKPALDFVFEPKRAIKAAIRQAGIPYTIVLAGGFASLILATFGQLDIVFSGDHRPPRENITILGTGEGMFVTAAEEDIGVLAAKAAVDPHTLNKNFVIRPKPNIMSFNAVVELWEKKLGHTLHKTFVPEAEVQKRIDEMNPPANFIQAVLWELVSELEVPPLNPDRDVAADELFPDHKYITVDEYLNKFV